MKGVKTRSDIQAEMQIEQSGEEKNRLEGQLSDMQGFVSQHFINVIRSVDYSLHYKFIAMYSSIRKPFLFAMLNQLTRQ